MSSDRCRRRRRGGGGGGAGSIASGVSIIINITTPTPPPLLLLLLGVAIVFLHRRFARAGDRWFVRLLLMLMLEWIAIRLMPLLPLLLLLLLGGVVVSVSPGAVAEEDRAGSHEVSHKATNRRGQVGVAAGGDVIPHGPVLFSRAVVPRGGRGRRR